jgi:hypothetical protein
MPTDQAFLVGMGVVDCESMSPEAFVFVCVTDV